MNIDDVTPFWIKVDICGRSAEWELAFIDRYDPEEPVIRFPLRNFEERGDPKRFSQCPQWKIAKPGSNESEVELLRAHPELTRLVPCDRSGEQGFRLMFRPGRGAEQEVVWIPANVVAARLSPHERDLMTARET